uniref:Coiled-coil domain containing 91 n=1 Tax=Nothoprocta perdicaria TaxID=30464 RepID=A0A8C6YMB3_NOTPE
MDDDDFGGFEAAESYESGNGETQTTSPAIPWAAFPTGTDRNNASILFHVWLKNSLSNSKADWHLMRRRVGTFPVKEYLLEKYSNLEMDFLKEKKEKVISHQDDYKMLQEKHKLELEDMRKAGHEALSIIVEEFKALLQSTVQQREAAIEKQYILTIEKHSRKCEELLNAQVWITYIVLCRIGCKAFAFFAKFCKAAELL